MAKKKLSRDQKRKQKKRKQQQRKQKPSTSGSTRSGLQIKVVKASEEEFAQAAADFAAQEARLKEIFNEKEIPEVTAATLQTYSTYIKERLQLPCLLTGIESMDYFGWEERFDFGYGSKTEYERLRKEHASYHDQYELEQFEAVVEGDWDINILVKVKRTTDGKNFMIPLSELEAVDQDSENYVLLNDYTVWVVNWR